MPSLSELLRAGHAKHPFIAACGVAVLSASSATAQTPLTRIQAEAPSTQSSVKVSPKNFLPASLAGNQVQVMVELVDPPAAATLVDARDRRHLSVENARVEMDRAAEAIRTSHKTLTQRLQRGEINATVLYSVAHAYNGIAILVDSANIERIRALAGVKAIHGLQPIKRMSHSSIAFLNTPNFWNTLTAGGLNIHGEGIKIGVVDTGIDYIHRNFGGSGSQADYATAASQNTIAPTAFFPNAIVAGGYDFAGDAYDAASTDSTYNPVPSPDPNPYDSTNPSSTGHGTGTGSIAGGRGVNADGTTFTGPYDSNVPLASMILGPGLAPAAQIYAYRVFGNFGSTNLVVQAVDRAIQDKVDVLSLSLGGDFGTADSPDSQALDQASAAGIICVAAAGNAGDAYYITGSPAASTRNISVAASYNSNYLIPTVNGVAPAAIAGKTFAFTPGSAGPSITSTIPAQDVVYALPHIGLAQNSDGSFPNLTNAAAINGHICLIDRGTYSFYVKVAEAQQAGATACIIANNQAGAVTPATSSSTYTPTIVNGIVSQADGNTIKATLDATNGTDTGTQVSFTEVVGSDTVPSYTSRGPRRPDGVLKPDITAPAEAVDVAAHLTGTGIEAFNGTSSATPHVAGAMALMKQAHPTWTVEQLKALVMNTADHDIFVNTGTTGTKIGPGRVGNGRMDLAPASTANVIAYNADAPGLVSVSFGSLDIPIDGPTITASHNIKVVNKGATAQTFNVAFVSVGTDVPGATFSVPATVTVPAATSTADGVATIPVTLTAVPTQLTHTHDPSIAATQGGLVRDYKAEATGYVELTPKQLSGTPIRVVVHAMPRPASTVHAVGTTLSLPGASGQSTLTMTGSGVATGSNYPVDIISLLKVLELQYVGSGPFNDGTYDDSANLQYVGVTSDYVAENSSIAATVFQFGLVAYADHAGPDAFNTEFDINIDTTGSSTFSPNYVVYNFLQGASPNYENVYTPFVVSYATGAAKARYFTNVYSSSGGLDTNIFNSNVITYPVAATDLGMAAGANTRIHYQVTGFYNGVAISQTPVMSYDPVNPGILVSNEGKEPALDVDGAGSLTLNYNNAAILANRSLGALAIHFHNADGLRADALATGKPTITSFTPASGKVGSTVTITGTNLTGTTSVTFFNKAAGTNIVVNSAGTSLTVTVPTGATTGTISVITPTGKATTTTKFVVTP